VAIEAARRLPDHPFTICGTGPLSSSLRKRAAGLPHVRFVGHLPRSQLFHLLSEARAIAVPSLWYENFPYAVLEAQAAGRAVVASRIGGIPEQVEHGIDGLLVEPGDPDALAAALRRVLERPEEARALGANGRERVHRDLGPDAHLQAILGHYRNVCGTGTKATIGLGASL
ncbi:MAG: glycosyltransferase family 4 protein, partial [Myxococcota bacterium]|jgi:glycosyltransferase involved in cell wall biosynthesis|nr:glycosyltransferase family 4 protein [Myxococcota bacterium]